MTLRMLPALPLEPRDRAAAGGRLGPSRGRYHQTMPHGQPGAAGARAEAKLQDALYRITEMASAANDMAEFYAGIHRIVGELTFADNFFIALYDADSQMLNYPYYRDQVDLDVPDPDAWEPMGTGQARGSTAYVLRTGVTQQIGRARHAQLQEAGSSSWWAQAAKTGLACR